MKAKKCILAVTAVICTVFFMISQADAQFGKGRGGRGQGMGTGFNCNLPESLNLTPDQTAGINSLHAKFFKETTDIRTGIFSKKQEMKALMLEKSPDVEKAKSIQTELSALKSRIAQKTLEYQFEARKLLTPEQIAQLPPGCTMGFGPMGGGRGCGFGGGRGRGDGPGCNMMDW